MISNKDKDKNKENIKFQNKEKINKFKGNLE